jgi:prepilin-type N-terminal cleavage/methylation domain-containing protein
MFSKLRKENKGFTIIEVLIVLAIAGLIMLIVFLAVPALQRNSRNSGRKSDMGRLGGEVNQYVANNNGTLPAEANMAAVLTQVGAFAQYAATDRVANATGTQPVLPSTSGQPRFRLVTSATCGAAGVTAPGSARLAVIQYQLETSNATAHTNICQPI